MKKLLITGFAPFGGESVNPSWEVVKRLPEKIGEWELTRLEVPVVYGLAGEVVLRAAEGLGPDAILCIGQAGGRRTVTPERIGINLRSTEIPDNAGNQPLDQPIIPGGPDGIFSTVPVRDMAKAICRAGFSGAVSNTAGAFVCNDLLYTLLHHYAGSYTCVGFIHVPFLPQQAKAEQPSMTIADMEKALITAINAM